LQVCLDAVNSVKFLSGYKETCRVLAPFAVSVHIKDVKLNRFGELLPHGERYQLSEITNREILGNFNTGFYISGCPLGEGIVDLPWIINELRQYGHDPALFVESWMDPRASLKETMEAEKHMVYHDFNELNKLTDE
jgi:sugar phosphate isomerase/epimerase